MKKYLETVAVLGLVFALAGCGQTAANGKAPVVSGGNSVAQILESAANSAESADAAGQSADDTEWDALDESAYDVFYDEGAYDSGWNDPETGESISAHDGIDVDLTRMSSTMVYGQVSDMMYLPEDYVGKTIRMRGQSYSSYYEETDTTYYYLLIADAAACCAQGLEYVLADGVEYPDEEAEATVTGVFEMYDELGITYCRLNNATLSAGL